jgi:hypothetical protein
MARIVEHLLVDPALPSIIGQPELSTSPAAGAASTRLRAVGSTPRAQIAQVEHARAVGVELDSSWHRSADRSADTRAMPLMMNSDEPGRP